MALRVVGAGLGRTGTNSLKLALERLLGEPCYHMLEVFPRPEHPPLWAGAYDGTAPDWDALFTGFGAAVDWPAAGLWRDIADAYPDALILLSVRDPDSWWRSASSTIFQGMEMVIGGDPDNAWTQMASKMVTAFCPEWRDESAAKAAFLAHNEQVRRAAPADRLLEWQASDGWVPICERLGLPVPDEPFPHVNTTEDFRAMLMPAESPVQGES
ncbi:MAG TPA: sulfotransferase [Mycobacteriales bacterium]|nr:sulfotransferase [Mycobacteriales bacterium]